MTFLLSEINHDGVIMASDSSESIPKPSGEVDFAEVDKTLYFKELNIGISTWGKSWVGSQNVNEWLKDKIQEFVITKGIGPNQGLAEVTSFLANRLGQESRLKLEDDIGLHVAGYNTDGVGGEPGICHVFKEKGSQGFQAQLTMLSLPKDSYSYHLRNGMYEEFSMMWPKLLEVENTFRDLVRQHHAADVQPFSDPTAVFAEWLGNWVKQMCLVFKTAGLPEYIGKTIKVLTFNQKGNVRWFRLKEFEEIN